MEDSAIIAFLNLLGRPHILTGMKIQMQTSILFVLHLCNKKMNGGRKNEKQKKAAANYITVWAWIQRSSYTIKILRKQPCKSPILTSEI